MEVLGLEAAAKPNSEVAKFIDAEVTVKRHEKEVVAGAVRNFRDGIVEQLKESTNWNWNYLNSGSSYDGTKVTWLLAVHIIIVVVVFVLIIISSIFRSTISDSSLFVDSIVARFAVVDI